MRTFSRRSFFKSGLFFSLVIGGSITTILGILAWSPNGKVEVKTVPLAGTIRLPDPKLRSTFSVEQAIFARRSRREYLTRSLTLSEAGQLLWAAQGVTEPKLWTGLRSSPSAGGLYPLETYIVVREQGVQGLDAGAYRYLPHEHGIVQVAKGDLEKDLQAACVDQEWVAKAALNIVFTSVPSRTTVKYGQRSWQYIFQESGHAAQNVYLQAEALGLGGTVIGAFLESEVQRILGISGDEIPVYVMPMGPIS